jgi:hypothetical protein
MSILFLREHTERIPAGTPLRDKFEAAIREIDAMEVKLSKAAQPGTDEKLKAKS